jgi:hypothetical protein
VDRKTLRINVTRAWKWRSEGNKGPWAKTHTHQKTGCRTFLYPNIEEQLAAFCKSMDSCNWSITRDILKDQARLLAKTVGVSRSSRRKAFSNNWVRGFIKRHNLKMMKCQAWEKARQVKRSHVDNREIRN